MRWDTLAKRIGCNIKKQRLAIGLSQEKAAEKAGNMSLRYWQFLEAGERNATLKTLVAVARALKIDPKKLM
ncbi:MAG: helix-turn-helix transcriptional regulator [bacterium]